MNMRIMPSFPFVIISISMVFIIPSVNLTKVSKSVADSERPMKFVSKRDQPSQNTFNETDSNSNSSQTGNFKGSPSYVGDPLDKPQVGSKKRISDRRNMRKSRPLQGQTHSTSGEPVLPDIRTKTTKSQIRRRRNRPLRRRHGLRRGKERTPLFAISPFSNLTETTVKPTRSFTARSRSLRPSYPPTTKSPVDNSKRRQRTSTNTIVADETTDRDRHQAIINVTHSSQASVNVTDGYSTDNVTRRSPMLQATSPPILLEGVSLDGTRADSDTSCPTCRIRQWTEEEVITLRTAQFKDIMLEKLRRSEDNLSTKLMRDLASKLPSDIIQKTLRDNARQESMEDFYAQDQELILTGQDLGRKCIRSRQVTGCYIFVLQGKVRREVASAQLWLYKAPDRNDFSGRQTIRVFELEKTSRGGRLRRRNLMVRHDTFVHNGWVTMNVTRSVRRWVDKNMRIAMVAIRCDTCRTRNHKALYGAKDGYRPLLVIDYDTSNEHSRKKRSESCDPRFECCKRQLVINFSRIEWHSVVEPHNIAIGYCFGYCNDSPSYNYNHTLLRQSARLKDSSLSETVRRQLQPCCAPLSFRDASLLVYDNHALVQTTIPNVIVSSCGCI